MNSTIGQTFKETKHCTTVTLDMFTQFTSFLRSVTLGSRLGAYGWLFVRV